MGGFSNAPRCPASLTFRDSPALLRQESDGYPVRTCCSTPTPTAHSPLLVPASNSPDPDKPLDVMGLCPARPRPFCPSHTPRPDMHIQDKPGVLLSKEKKKWEVFLLYQKEALYAGVPAPYWAPPTTERIRPF